MRLAFAGLAAAFLAAGAQAQEVDPVGLTPTPPPPPGMAYASDAMHRVASHACGLADSGCAIATAPPPSGIARSPADFTQQTKVLVRRGTAIFYVPEVAGAADYRAYVVTPGVTFANGDPKGAVIACSGYRQHPRNRRMSGNVIQLELARQFELPLPATDNLVVIEALDRPCPFRGALGYKDGTIPADPAGVQGKPWVGSSFPIVSFDTMRTETGNEWLNAQGAASAYDITLTPGALRGQPVPYVQPRILGRAVLAVTAPATDEPANAPIADMGDPAKAGVFDDFSTNGIVKLSRSLPTNRGGDQIWAEGSDANWHYWVNRAQKGQGDTNSDDVAPGMSGAQVWKRHGRLFATLADFGQETMTGMHFTSKTVPTRPVDAVKYTRASFRVEGNATDRRYWTLALCGADSDAKLVQQDGRPRARFNLNSFFYTNSTGSTDNVAPDVTAYPGVGSDAVNPTVRLGEFSGAAGDAFDPRSPGPENNLECLQVAAFDGLYQPAFIGGQNRWYESGLRAFVNPAGKAIGVHSLVSARFTSNPGNANQYFAGAPSHYFTSSPAAPITDNFLLPGVPAHFDFYVRRDRMVVYVNGRQGMCINFDRPLEMQRGKWIFGQIVYHTRAEAGELRYAVDGYSAPTGQYHYIQNMPAADTRSWDFAGEAHNIDVPDPLPGRTPAQGGFDPSQCEQPDPQNFRFPLPALPPAGDEDGDGIPNGVELAESRDPRAKDNDVFGNARLFAMQQYRDFLGREGDAGGIQYYTDLLGTGAATRSTVIESFLASPEFLGGLPQATRLYFSFFGRIPDYDGLLFQASALRGGAPLGDVAQNFANSPEFTARYGALTNDEYINLVYQNVLGRAPDAGGFQYYKDRLDDGRLTRGQMMVGFSESPEFTQLKADAVFVVSAYVGMLRRAPEQAGLDFYVQQLGSGTPRNAIVAGFFGSPEYRARFLP